MSNLSTPERNSEKGLKEKWFLALGIFIILLIVGLAIYIAILLGSYISRLDPQPGATITSALLGLVSVLASILINSSLSRRAEKDREHLARRADAYQSMVQGLLKFIGESRMEANLNEDEQKEKQRELMGLMRDFSAHTIVWGSPKVLKAWNEYRQYASNDTNHGPDFGAKSIDLIGKIFLAMRADLGHKSEDTVTSYELTKTFINY